MPLLDATGLIESSAEPKDMADVQAHFATAPLSNEKYALTIANNADITSLAEILPHLALISIAFPSFSDGRGFSLARRLRAAGFAGRLRASGPLIVDQFRYALACGFDEIELPEPSFARQPAAQWLAALKAAGPQYQRGYQRGETILDARTKARVAAIKSQAHV